MVSLDESTYYLVVFSFLPEFRHIRKGKLNSKHPIQCLLFSVLWELGMPNYADLEISIHRRDAESYGIELRFTPPDADVEVRLVRGGLPVAQFSLETLKELTYDNKAYGKLLSDCLFADPTVREAFEKARISTES